MGPEAWKRRIGESAWKYLLAGVQRKLAGPPPAAVAQAQEEMLSDLLTRMTEAGWRGPEKQPEIDPQGTRVLWPGPVQDGDETVLPALTSEGLLVYWHAKGHGFLLLRAEQACRAMAGPLAARFQELLASYEDQCVRDGVAALPDYADCRVFVGGDRDDRPTPGLIQGLLNDSPRRKRR
tara:strand:+ start:3000 stop:3536 length:537 start_codon:yes stop_codon:yes gene_type:complete